MTWVAAMIAMCCPWIVVVYGVKACAAFCPMPRIVYPVCARVAKAVWSPGGPQSSPWLLASVISETPAPLNASTTVGGA